MSRFRNSRRVYIVDPGAGATPEDIALVDRLLRFSEREPLLFVLEDAHWIDPTTLELLTRFIDSIGRWSSIDLFMISILVALVQFGNLTRVRPEGGG